MTVDGALRLRVNGAERTLDVPRGRSLLRVLREDLGLTGTKEGCDDGTCGACTVTVDGKMRRACRVDAGEAAGRAVLTIEGLGTPARLHPLQLAFVEADAVQCGFCTPGMIMAAKALLDEEPHPTRELVAKRLGSNLCRCTGYRSIEDAILWAATGATGPARPWLFSPLPGELRGGSRDKVTGRAVYAADLPLAGVLHAKALRSPHAHARVRRIDTSRAAALPGVVAVLTARDIPGRNGHGRMLKDEPVLAADRVRQIGDPVAVVAAETIEEAEAALALITVDWDVLPAVHDPEAALAPDAPLIGLAGNLLTEDSLRVGDARAAMDRADVIVSQRTTTPFNEHAYLEPESALAYLDGDTLVVRTATQHPHYQRSELAAMLGWPAERVRVHPTIIGGAFGAKTDISCQGLVALLAAHTGRPVRMVYTRTESFLSTPKRHPFRMDCRIGARRDGTLLALEVDILADSGAYASTGPARITKAFGSAPGPYRWEAVDLHGRAVYTNNTTAGSFRSPGTAQVAFAVEVLIDLLAEKLQLDPLALREKNRLRRGDLLPSGQRLEREPAYAATIAAVRPHLAAALERRDAARRASRTVRRGVGVASMWYGIGGASAGLPGRAEVELLADGTVVLRTGVVDLGQGSSTALARIAAEALGLRSSEVAVVMGDTSVTADAGGTSGSRVTYAIGNAVRSAASALAALLGPAAGRRPLADLAHERLARGLPLRFEGTFMPPRDEQGRLVMEWVSATHVAEVEVDDRGRTRVLRVVAAHEAGRPAFPQGVVGQIEGAVVMGVGFALSERYVPGATTGFGDYRIPRFADAPEIEALLVEELDGGDPLEARGIAESANMSAAPAVVNAIADATGVRIVDLPAAPALLARAAGAGPR